MFSIGLGHYLTLAAVIFTIGIVGIFLNRKNVIVILMSIELILLAVNINLVSFSIYLGDLSGQVFTLFILTVAAAEAAIGLAIIVVYYRNSGTIRVEEIDNLKGLEVDLVYKWKIGDLLVFDRTSLHCASSNLRNKKIGFTSSTIKLWN